MQQAFVTKSEDGEADPGNENYCNIQEQFLGNCSKIEDAQKRIEHILKRLPEQSDSRQMNLLGDNAIIDKDHDPTTHWS